MDIYLPITEVSVNILHLIALGGGVGFLSGLLGISGGFLLTPILILLGIPSSIAVASQSAGVIATSTTGFMGHWSRGNVDFTMATCVLLGGVVGSSLGIWLFTVLHNMGQLDIAIKVSYVVLLSIIGVLMLWELAWTKYKTYQHFPRGKLHEHNWLHYLPFRVRFKKSRLYISAIPPVLVGFVVGALSALMGVGGGFIMIPAMIYILGMHTSVVVGTSLFQSIFVAINATFWQASINYTVDIVLAIILVIGGVLGAIIGSKLTARLKGEQLRFLLAFLILLVAIKLLLDLFVKPDHMYSLTLLG